MREIAWRTPRLSDLSIHKPCHIVFTAISSRILEESHFIGTWNCHGSCPQVASQRQSDHMETALHLLLESGSIGIIGVRSFY
jgi:hypothetical protein